MKNEQLQVHLRRDHYGAFRLTEAIRPSPELEIVPKEGYRIERRGKHEIPSLVAAVSSERLFEVFLDLLSPLGEEVDVILETSHDSPDGEHRDLARENIDTPVLMSHFCDHEEMLMNDGCAGVAVLNGEKLMEVQFDEHKLLIVYARNLKPFELILEDHGIQRDDRLKLIIEAPHLHSTQAKYAEEFEQFSMQLGIGELVEQVNWE